ncbi:MAG: transcriptional regulator NrdR [Bacteroides sp.]|nr:transcriptional regulator NrdR [Bacteroides sp.]
MRCPSCGFDDSKVIDSRPTENRIRRRRECLKCRERFTTYEEIENTPLMVTKRDGSVEEFKRDKLLKSIVRAAANRSTIDSRTANEMVDGIVCELRNNFKDEVTSTQIGEMALRKLKAKDAVAYIRFASVYQKFNDAESFIKVITELSEDKEKGES